MASRKTSASFPASSSVDSSCGDDDDSVTRKRQQQQQQQHRKSTASVKRKNTSAGGKTNHHHPQQVSSDGPMTMSMSIPQGAIIMMFLLMGLGFCILDCFYMFHYVLTDRHVGAVEDFEHVMHRQPVDISNLRVVIPEPELQHVPHEVLSPEDFFNKQPRLPPVAESHEQQQNEEQEQQPQKSPQQQQDEESTKQDILNDPERAHLIQLLRDAQINMSALPLETLQQLPKWSDVTALYGDHPIYVGMETCEHFQKYVPDPAEHFVSTAGTFNTGTNLMAELLIENCHLPARMTKYGARSPGVRWQVLWGKHTPVFNETFRQGHRTYEDPTLTANHIFPAVMVRDPYKWMQSMCRHEYGAEWPHNSSAHCPNLVPNEVDLELMNQINTNRLKHNRKEIQVTPTGGVPLAVQYKEFRVEHDTLVGFWNDWYSEYAAVKWPRLLVRFEDLIFYPQEVTKTVCECAGGELNKGQPFKFVVESAKRGIAAHGKVRTTYIDALVKYGTEKGRYNGYEPADVEYARQHLKPELMELFHYKQPSPLSSP